MLPAIPVVLCLVCADHPGEPLIHAINQEGRVWTRGDLAEAIYQACRVKQNGASRREVVAWAKLLSSERPLRTDKSLASGLLIREVAITCIEELTGESFLGKTASQGPVREILSTSNHGDVERFHIPQVSPENVAALRNAVRDWIAKH